MKKALCNAYSSGNHKLIAQKHCTKHYSPWLCSIYGFNHFMCTLAYFLTFSCCRKNSPMKCTSKMINTWAQTVKRTIDKRHLGYFSLLLYRLPKLPGQWYSQMTCATWAIWASLKKYSPNAHLAIRNGLLW